MTRPPAQFMAELRTLRSPFTREDVEQKFADLSPSSISVYLSHAARAGLIRQVGLKRFRHVEPETPRRLSRFGMKTLESLRGAVLPSGLEQVSVWTDEDLAPFTHDAFVDPFVVMEGPKEVLHTMREILEPSQPVAMVRSMRELGEAIWAQRLPQARIFLMPVSRLNGTKPTTLGVQQPTLERLLVTILQFPAILPDAAIAIMEHPEFRLRGALDAAPSKRVAALLGSLVEWLRHRHPSHPVHRQWEDVLRGERRW